MNLIDQQIDLLKLEKQSLETTARVGFDLLKILPAEISTEASSEDEKWYLCKWKFEYGIFYIGFI